jgi:hypothetical protein
MRSYPACAIVPELVRSAVYRAASPQERQEAHPPVDRRIASSTGGWLVLRWRGPPGRGRGAQTSVP